LAIFLRDLSGESRFFSLNDLKIMSSTISGVDFRIGTNELQCALIPEHDQVYSDLVLHDYLKFMFDTLKAAGVRNNQIMLSIAGTHVRSRVTLPLVSDYPGVVEQQHGPNSPETLEAFLAACSTGEVDEDGFDRKAAGYTNEYDYSMLSIEQCRETRRILIERGVYQFHIFMGYAEGMGWMDIKQARWDEQRALAGK
jgi:hypothetical protein